MMNKKELALRALTLALTVSLAGAAVSVGTPTTAYAAEANTTQVTQEVEKWTPAKVYKDMRLGQTWGDWNYNTSSTPGMAPSGWKSTIFTEWLNDPHFVLAQARATSLDGIELKSMFLQPVDLTNSGRINRGYTYTNNTAPIKKYMLIADIGSCDPGQTLWTYMQQALINTATRTNATAVGDTYMDVYEDETYQRFTFNVTRINLAYNTVEKGYTVYVWNKQVNRAALVDYFEFEGAYNDERALTVVYSYMPIY